MPVIPFTPTSPGAVPNTGGNQPRANPNIAVPTPYDPTGASAAAATLQASAFQSTQRAGDRLADAGGQFADLYIKAKMNVAAADWKSDLSRQLQEAEFESSKIPDRQRATEDYDGRVQKIRDQFSTQDVNPLIRASVNEHLPQQVDLRRAATQNAAFNLEGQAERGKMITQLDGYTKMAAEATDPRLRDTIIDQGISAIDGRVAGGWMRADQAAQMKVDFKSNVYRTQIETVMSKDVRAGVALASQLAPHLNAKDSRDIGIMSEDRKIQLRAEDLVNGVLPSLGSSVDNNIGNITRSAARYAGGKGTPAGPFETFETPEHGAAAAYSLIKTKVDQNGGSLTFTELIGGNRKVPGWAPADDGKDPMLKGNQVSPYASNLAKSVGLTASDPIPIGDDDKMAKILQAMNRHEKGKQTISDEKFAKGVRLAKGDQTAVDAPTGDELANYRIRALKAEQDILADNTLDPRIKAQSLAILRQRSGTTNAIVLEERKAADDEAETASFGLFTGKYKDGTFQGLADKYRASGDNSKATAYQFMADNESAFKDFGNQPPGAQRTMAGLLPGAAGKIAHSILSDQRTDRTEFRRLGGEQARVFNEGLNSDVDPQTLIGNARDAIQYYAAAGDTGKVKSLVQQFEGAITGHRMAQLPPADREKALSEIRELAQSPDGLSIRDATIIRQLQKAAGKSGERWENDPLAINNDRGAVKLQPFSQQLDGVNLSLWAGQRYRDVVKTQLDKNPNATNLQIPYFTQAEMSEISGQLAKGTVQARQIFLAKLATAVPEGAIPLIGDQMSKSDVMSDGWASAMALYKRGKPGDTAIADSIVAGANLLAEGGPDGKLRIALNRETFSQIDSQLGPSRAGMDGRQIALQNNAIAARYVSLTATAKDHSSLDPDKLNQAIKDVVGTSMSLNGGSFILPREIEPFQFRDGVAAISESDVAGLRPAADGSPITAEKVRRYATYQSVGDGLYKVRMPDPRNGGTSELLDATGRPWVIDIRPFMSRGKVDTPRYLQQGPTP